MKLLNNDQKSVSFFKEMKEFIRPYNKGFVLSVIISIIGVFCNLLSYLFAGEIAGKIFGGEKSFNVVVILLALVVLCKLLSGVFMNVSTTISHKAAFKTLRDIRLALAEKMMKLPLGYFEKTGSGRIKTTLVDRVESIEKTLAHILPEVSGNLAAPILMTIWAFFIDYRIALIMTIWFFVGLLFSGGMMYDYNNRYNGYVEAEKNMNEAIVEYVRGIEVIKNFNRTESSFKKYIDAIKKHSKVAIKWQKQTQVFMGLSMTVTPYSIFPVIISGLIFVNNGSLTGEKLFLLILISLGIYEPLARVINYSDSIAVMGTVASEVKEILYSPELERADGKITSGNMDIEIKNVDFSYDNDENKALDNVSLTIKYGEMTALVGESGSGKSTIAKLLAGYWDKNSGSILIGGKDISTYSQEEINRYIAYVDQETFLYNMSILDNIRIGKKGASDEEVIEAARKAGCDEFIRALPDGYFTNAGVAGTMLSGGERQRIAIVRAMLKNAPIMIMDEATASSDPENEASIQEALSVSARGKTLIVVAHRLSTIVNADNIVLMEAGKVKAAGTHTELLEGSEKYKKMWEISEGEE